MNNNELAQYIDHTLLKPSAGIIGHRLLCAEAFKYGFASVCVLPSYVELCANILKGSSIGLATVVGFPLGATFTEVKVEETRQAIKKGATEIDMVMDIPSALTNSWPAVEADIKRVIEAASGALVKVILETCLLNPAQIVKVCHIALEAGADFVKTSTGFGTAGATLADISLMKEATAGRIGIKASGGIRSRKTALNFIAAGATRLGTSSAVAILAGDNFLEQ